MLGLYLRKIFPVLQPFLYDGLVFLLSSATGSILFPIIFYYFLVRIYPPENHSRYTKTFSIRLFWILTCIVSPTMGLILLLPLISLAISCDPELDMRYVPLMLLVSSNARTLLFETLARENNVRVDPPIVVGTYGILNPLFNNNRAASHHREHNVDRTEIISIQAMINHIAQREARPSYIPPSEPTIRCLNDITLSENETKKLREQQTTVFEKLEAYQFEIVNNKHEFSETQQAHYRNIEDIQNATIECPLTFNEYNRHQTNEFSFGLLYKEVYIHNRWHILPGFSKYYQSSGEGSLERYFTSDLYITQNLHPINREKLFKTFDINNRTYATRYRYHPIQPLFGSGVLHAEAIHHAQYIIEEANIPEPSLSDDVIEEEPSSSWCPCFR